MDATFAKIEDSSPSEKIEDLTKSITSPSSSSQSQTSSSQSKGKTSSPPTKTSNIIKYVLIFILIVTLIALIIFFFVKSSSDELSETRKDVEAMRRNEAVLKTRINAYEEQLRRMKVAEQQRLHYDHDFGNPDKLPDAEYYADVPADTDNNVRRKPDPRIESKKQLMAMVNQKRETVADLQQVRAAKEEAERRKQTEQIQQEIEDKTHSAAFKDDKVNEVIFDAVSNGGSLVDE